MSAMLETALLAHAPPYKSSHRSKSMTTTSKNSLSADEAIAGWMSFAHAHMERGNYWHTHCAAYKEAYEEKSKMLDTSYIAPPPLPGKDALRKELDQQENELQKNDPFLYSFLQKHKSSTQG